MERMYPPRVDATADELATAFFRALPRVDQEEPNEYWCVACGRDVYYPEILYRDEWCEQCHEARPDS